MPVDPDDLDGLAASVVDIYQEAELTLLRLIADRLVKDLDAPEWARRRLAEVQALRRAAAVVVTRLASDSDRAVTVAVAGAYRAGNAAAVADLADTLAPDLAEAARAAAANTSGGAVQALAHALRGELGPVHAHILPSVTSTYQRAIAGATARVLAGAQGQRRAAQAAWAALVDRGITGFTDSTGREWKLHSYVAMAVRTAVARAAMAALVDTYTLAGQRLVYVPDRPGECHMCRPWESKVLALWGDAGPADVPRERGAGVAHVEVAGTLAQARAAGLHHPNCSHTVSPWIAGVTRMRRATEDAEGYEARQRQRQIERHLRHWRERQAAALTDEARKKAGTYVAAWDAEMGRHLESTGLKRLRHREKPGAGFEAPASRHTDRADLPAR